MGEIQSVLCPVDRSDTSARALEYAAALARQVGARLTVLEVIDWAVPLALEQTPGLHPLPDVDAAVKKELDQFVAAARSAGVRLETAVATGPVVATILEHADAVSADLVVIGTRGRSGPERLVLGSVAERVLRRAGRLVLTVPAAAPAPPASLFRTMLCATDFSEPAAVAVRQARRLARQLGSRLLLAHVVEWPFGRTTGDDPVSELRRSLLAEAADQLAALDRETASEGGAVEPLVTAGQPKQELTTLVRDHAVDLVIMGVAGRGAIDLALLGSTTQGVVRAVACPVLTVPASSRPSAERA